MADIIHVIFKNKKVNLSKLVPFGFQQKDSYFVYEKFFTESELKLVVTITMEGTITAEIFDTALNESYILHVVNGATGSFVGEIKAQYEESLTEIATHCFEEDVFKFPQAKEVINYVRNTYADELEFLWKTSPNNAIWRRKDTKKWYGALLTVSKRKLGIDSDEMVEIIDFRMNPDELSSIIDNKAYFPGYHMNKTHWCTIILDYSVSSEEIYDRINQSYLLAVK